MTDSHPVHIAEGGPPYPLSIFTQDQNPALYTQCQALREAIFMGEQGAQPDVAQWHRQDETAIHWAVFDPNPDPAKNPNHEPGQQHLVATGLIRFEPDTPEVGIVARMVVLKEYRGHGLGRLMLLSMDDHAQSLNLKRLRLIAQIQAQGFYEKLGYSVDGEPFTYSNIAHIWMEKSVA